MCVCMHVGACVCTCVCVQLRNLEYQTNEHQLAMALEGKPTYMATAVHILEALWIEIVQCYLE